MSKLQLHFNVTIPENTSDSLHLCDKETQHLREKHEPRLRGIDETGRMTVLLSSDLLEMKRAVLEVQGVRRLLSAAGLAGGSPEEVVMLILPFPLCGLELIETSNSKKEKQRN